MISSEEASRCVVAEIAPTDYSRLVQFGISETEGRSWTEGEGKLQGLQQLFREAGIAPLVELTFEEVPVEAESTPGSLEEHFEQFANLLCSREETRAAGRHESILVVNLLPFYLSTTRLDKIVSGLFSDPRLQQFFETVVLLLRNIDWLLKSNSFQQLCTGGTLRRICAIDIRCFTAQFVDGALDRGGRVTRAPFRRMLNTGREQVYRSLVFETNSYIGHFILKDSHVRTHYDLTDFVKRDNVWEFLHEKFTRELGEVERVLIIGVGMEHSVISRVGQQLSALLGEDLAIMFVTADDLSPADRVPPDWHTRFDSAFVVTDIVNTGKTVEPWVLELRRTSQGKPVRVFSVARMQNSPKEISGIQVVAGVEIRRNYYSPTNCVLCAIKQPKVEVQKASDFRKICPEQPTPYDFWEMIKETHAFRRSQRDPQGRSLLFRIDTEQIVRRYSGWLSNLIRQRFEERWPNMRPDAICTIADEPGESFAVLVARSLNVPPPVRVRREALKRASATGLPPDVAKPFDGRENVLIVDDGINYGETARRLIGYCRAAGSVPMGVLVLDSRLPLKASDGISALMGRHPVVALYNWPSRMRGL